MKSFIAKKLRDKLEEVTELPIKVGDTVLMGKFKNKKVVIKTIDWDEEKGDLKINGKPALKFRLSKKLSESLVFEYIDSIIDEEYPTSWDIDTFKGLKSFNARIKYCEANLQRISSGSSRIVYKIDEEKVLKLAKNQKGLAQNETEIEYSHYNDLSDVLAKVYEYDEGNLWVEMELARKVKVSDFKRITGFTFKEFVAAVHNYGIDTGDGRGYNSKMDLDPQVLERMWEDEFVYGIFDYIGNYGVPVGDLKRLSTYGIVKGDNDERIVIIDYGLSSDVYTSYYK